MSTDRIMLPVGAVTRRDLSIDEWKGRNLHELGDELPAAVIIEEGRALIMRPHGNRLIKQPRAAGLRVVDPALAEARKAACQACSSYSEASDKCRLCGCGFVCSERVHSPFARCPKEAWPCRPA